ncbi:MAG: AAC(3) family N-acetyltransferase [Rhodospirillales bacterium]|nr:AAC(3) family N-acetyltransferase [Rhodospirillales bacterium]
MAYSFDDILETYAALGVDQASVVYVTSDLVPLMVYEDMSGTAVLEAHFKALLELLGPEGTLVVPTGSTNLCNTDIVFDPATTPVYQVGQLSEFVRRQPEALRSFHPFVSYAAIGPQAGEITQNVSRHAFGPNTPEGRMASMDTLSISIGLYPRHTCSTVHHVEQIMAVPYRYTKEFMHPVMRDGEKTVEPFYLHVWYRDCGIERSNTKWIFQHLDETDLVKNYPLGAGHVYAYSMGNFVKAVTDLMTEDIYIWCDRPPTQSPWRE